MANPDTQYRDVLKRTETDSPSELDQRILTLARQQAEKNRAHSPDAQASSGLASSFTGFRLGGYRQLSAVAGSFILVVGVVFLFNIPSDLVDQQGYESSADEFFDLQPQIVLDEAPGVESIFPETDWDSDNLLPESEAYRVSEKKDRETAALARSRREQSRQSPQLEEIIVTAAKRAESLEESPVSVQGGDASSFSFSESLSTTTAMPDLIDLKDHIPSLIIDLKYFGSDNFFGNPVPGYQAHRALLSEPAAEALSKVQETLLRDNLSLKIFDAYRPQRAVDAFLQWANSDDDVQIKSNYYPNIEKSQLFALGYLAARSSHSRGSTVDLTIVALAEDSEGHTEWDMGTPFDFFDERSWPDSDQVSDQAQRNRLYLRELMQAQGFVPFESEWWHFTYGAEPYPDQYFDLVIE